jgi:prepilin-type N-terminal cleavage/methylation domain-containing protein
VKTKRTVTSGKWQVAGAGSQSAHLVTRHSSPVTRAAFTLIEIMVAVALLSLIVFALMTVFNSTQSAFRASVTQTDVLEGGRATIDLIANDLKPMAPAYAGTNINNGSAMNFYVFLTNSFTQSLQPAPANGASRTNVMEDMFFITHENQNWKGIGYFVRTNDLHVPGDLGIGNVGSLYRYETNVSTAQFAGNPAGLYFGFNLARSGSPPTNTTSRILDGVMSFTIHAFDTNGFWIVTNLNANIFAFGNFFGEVGTYGFYSNALPASVEIELGVLEDRALKRVESLPSDVPAPPYDRFDLFLKGQAGKVHIFRQRILIPNANPSAYQ